MDQQSPAVETESGTEPVWRGVAAFLIHQFIATVGIAFTAPIGLDFFADFVRPFGWILFPEKTSQLLTRTPYFPVHIVFALFTGWALGRSFPRKSMCRVWILPLSALTLAFELYPAHQLFVIGRVSYLGLATPISHFFGRGCDVRKLCFDQLYLTMPFYTSVAYSIGSWLAQRHSPHRSQEPVRVLNPRRTFFMSGIVWLVVMLASIADMSGIDNIPLFGKVAFVLTATIVFAAATTLLTLIGAGLVGHFRKRTS